MLNILLLEDDPEDAELIRCSLLDSEVHMQMSVASTKEQYLSALGRKQVDLILSDFSLPGFDGWEALRSARQRRPEAPFIFVSGTMGEETAIRALKRGATDYILKDRLARLAPSVRRAVDEARRQRELKRIRGERRRLHRIIETTPDFVAIMDSDCRIVYLNPQGRRMLGIGQEALPAPTAGDPGYEWASRIMEAEKLRVAALKGAWIGESTLISRSGREIPVSQVVIAHKDQAGEIEYFSTLCRNVESLKQSQIALENSQKQLRELAGHLQDIREEERARVSRDIHDEFGQSLTAIRMGLSWLQKRLADAPASLAKLQQMEQLVDQTIQAVRRIVSQLRPAILDDLGLFAAIAWQAREFQKQTGIACEVEIDPMDPTDLVGQNMTIALFRIFQETMTNAARHAQATCLRVHCSVVGDRLVLRVEDDGIGISRQEASDPRSFGLVGLKERVVLLGGHVSIRGKPGKGTKVAVTIPLSGNKGRPCES